MKKLLSNLLVFFALLLLTACDFAPAKAPTYDTATLLFFNDGLNINGKLIKVPKEIPANFTELPYNEVFVWNKYVCEIRFAETRNSMHFYSVFTSWDFSRIFGIAKVQGADKSVLFWTYDKSENAIKKSYVDFKKELSIRPENRI